ncbi:type 2 lanthipeptide synthetase LanM [Pseudomonas sp. Eth.TT006]
MLTDVLSFTEGYSCGVGPALDQETLRKTLELLHRNDEAVLCHFGVGREALLEAGFLRAHFEGADDSLLFEKHEEAIKTVCLLSLACEVEGKESFNRFYASWVGYFKYVFEKHVRYKHVSGLIDVTAILSDAGVYVTTRVKYLAEKSLVHQLNSLIAEGAVLDLETFDHALAGESLLDFLRAYPVLVRLLTEMVEDTVTYLYKVIEHFDQDFSRLAPAFALDTRRIDSIVLGQGDAHANGETVCFIEVSGRSLVYKPRSNHEAIFYGALLQRLHDRTADSGFAIYSPVMVSLENRCWMEKIENRACESEAQLAVFFQRLGSQVAVIHALNGIDFHYENLIACGSSPVMIDLECLFTSTTIDLRTRLPHSGALFKAIKLTGQSVFASGFLPYSASSDNDYSGLSRQQQFAGKRNQLVRENAYYRLKKVDFDSRPVLRHLPVFNGETHSVTDYKEAFLRGFECGYDQMISHRGAVLDLLAQHAGALKTRVLIKNTQRYADFISMMIHPRFTRCAVQRELLLATLWSELSEALNDYGVPAHEIADLRRANIPCFTLPLLSNRLLDAHGQEVAALAIESPFDSCRRKMEHLSCADKALQMHILQMCLFPVANEALPLNRAHHLKAAKVLSKAQYLEGAISIHGITARQRIDGEEGDVAWTFMDTHPRTRRSFIAPMGNGLYNGMGGLAIFYLSLFRTSRAPGYLRDVERILCAMTRSQDHFPHESSVSAYFGITSYLYVLVNYQLISGHRSYQAVIEEQLLKLGDFPRDGDEFDVIHGWCGAVIVLVNYYQLEKRETLRPLIERYSQAIQSALTLENGKLLLKTTGKPLWTGVSHGISGVLIALGKVWEVTRDPLLPGVISQWLQAENRLMADGFWLDLRENAASSTTIKWCHGDAGILLCRHGLLQTMAEVLDADTRVMLEQDAQRCERHVWQHGLGSGYSLCHGDFGNLVCLLRFYRDTHNDRGIAKVNRALSQVAHNFFKEDFLEERNVPDLGLMLGIAGVGQALLHALDDGLPDVLCMDFARSTPPA